jgi:hypothetical protein
MGERNPAEADPDQADWLNCPDHEDGDDEEPRGLPKPEDFD